MLKLSFADQIEYRRLAGRETLVDTPPECAYLWEKGKAAGFHLGRLYMVNEPLDPGAGGAWHRESGDVWLHCPPSPDSPVRSQTNLLHELAHADLRTRATEMLDGYWDGEAATWRRARELAVEWGVEHLLTQEALEGYLQETEELREAHRQAGSLAGSLCPYTAGRAYDALRIALAERLGEQSWDHDLFEAVLYGYCELPDYDAAAVDFDRSLLRGCWSLGYTQNGDFGSLALPQDEKSAGCLRYAMQHITPASRRRGDWKAGAQTIRYEDGEVTYLFHTRVESDADLEQALWALNSALLDYPQASVMAHWDCFGDDLERQSARIYHLSVHYEHPDGTSRTPITRGEIWVLCQPRHEHSTKAEAALQRFIRGWLRVQGLRCGRLSEGLYELWSWQEAAQRRRSSAPVAEASSAA
ncbi:MAG: hypothetical protein IVW55_00600 [Chloroflexi bacterium]|nr:hypothetical protein [Chloroflexota bacterium]